MLTTHLFSQNPIIWKKTYNSANYRSLKDIIIADTSYYILVKTNGVELVNINKNIGVLNFSMVYSGQGVDDPYNMYQANSTINIFGETTSSEGIFNTTHGGKDIFSIKTDLNGNLIDTNFFGGSLGESGIVN